MRAAEAPGVGTPFGAPEDVTPAGQASRFGHGGFFGDRPVVVLATRPAGGKPVAQAYVR